MKKKGLTPKKLIQKVFQWILVVFGVLNNILKVYQNIPPRKPSFPRWRPKWRRGAWNGYISNWKNAAKEFSTDSGTLGHAYEHTKNLGNTPSGKASFSRWRPKWWPAKLKMAIYLNRKRLFKWFFLDSGTCKYAYEHTNNLGKYTSQKGFIFIMASKMAAWSLEWLYLKWKMLQKNVSTDSGTSIHWELATNLGKYNC